MSKWNNNSNRYTDGDHNNYDEAYGGGYNGTGTRQKADHHLRPTRSSPSNGGPVDQYRAPSHDDQHHPTHSPSSSRSPHGHLYGHGDDVRDAAPANPTTTLRDDDGVFVAPGRHNQHMIGGGPSPPKHSHTNNTYLPHQHHPPTNTTSSGIIHAPSRGGGGVVVGEAVSGSSAAAILSALQDLKDEVRELRGLKTEVLDLRGEVRDLKSEIRGLRSELQNRDITPHHQPGIGANTMVSNHPPNSSAGGGINKQQYVASDCNIRSCELCNIKFQYKIACQHFSGRRHQDCLRELRHSKDPSYGDWIIHMKEEYGFDQHAHVASESQSSPAQQPQQHAPHHHPMGGTTSGGGYAEERGNRGGSGGAVSGRIGFDGGSIGYSGGGMDAAHNNNNNNNTHITNPYQRQVTRPATTGGGIDTHPPIQNNFRRLY